MRRRDFITLLGGAAAAWPLAVRAQQGGPGKVWRVGVLLTGAGSDPRAQNDLKAFRQALQQLGLIDGQNVRIEVRSSENNPSLNAPMAAELAGFADVILVGSTPGLAAMRQATSTVPIVFTNLTDPVGQGFVASLAKPGANITGFANFERSIGGKWVEILREISPGLARVAVVFNPEATPQTSFYVPTIEAAARQLGIEPSVSRVRDDSEMDRALAAVAREANAGLIVPPGENSPAMRKSVIETMARYHVPAIYWNRVFAAEGGLVAYGSDEPDLFRRAGSYVDRILKGEKPADLPVQLPTKFELVINLKTAKALGIVFPDSLQIRADEVIE
jgi:putative ABC transport system substrate-binding protein